MASIERTLIAEKVDVAAEGVIAVSLIDARGNDLPAWEPGAHIDVVIDGQMERHYSLCSDIEDRRRWRIAILREPDSRGGSKWLHESLQPGQPLTVREPVNNFPLEDAGSYLLIAGGIGVTPMLSMAARLQQQGKVWTLVYGGRRRSSMAFLHELERYGDRVSVLPEDEVGLLDLDALLGKPVPGQAVYCCGPERLLEAVESRCTAWPEGALHVERFRPKPGALEGNAFAFEVELRASGKRCVVHGGETIIQAIDRLGLHVPRSCGEGTCGTCATAVLEGIPDHRDSFLMGKKRVANKTICVCCSRSLTPLLVLDL